MPFRIKYSLIRIPSLNEDSAGPDMEILEEGVDADHTFNHTQYRT